MPNAPTASSRFFRLLLGGAIGLVIHLVTVGGILTAAVMANVLIGPPGVTAEGAFWGQFIAFLSAPAGVFTGAITGFVGSAGRRSRYQTTSVGAAVAMFNGALTYAIFHFSLQQPNFVMPGLVLLAGLLIAGVVAQIKSAKRAA